MAASRGRTPYLRASWLNVALGSWIAVSPWLLGCGGNEAALWNNGIAGVLVVVAGVMAARSPDSGASLCNLALGVWLFISPYVLSFQTETCAAVNDVLAGTGVGVVALLDGVPKSGPLNRPRANGR